MRDSVDLDDRARAFLTGARSATLATVGPAGRPRLVPICFVALPAGADGGPPRLYSPLDEKPKATPDPRNLARVLDLVARPEATLLIDRWSEDWARLGWLRLDVRGMMIEPAAEGHAGAVEALRVKYRQYREHDLETRPMLRFEIERAVAWGALGAD